MGSEEERRDEAEEAVRGLRVKRYIFTPSGRDRWIVVGRHRDYIVLPTVPYCSCDDYFFRVIHRGKPSCYHIEAVRTSMKEERYELIEEEDYWYNKLMEEWTDWERGRREE